jgi:hypothetical protein
VPTFVLPSSAHPGSIFVARWPAMPYNEGSTQVRCKTQKMRKEELFMKGKIFGLMIITSILPALAFTVGAPAAPNTKALPAAAAATPLPAAANAAEPHPEIRDAIGALRRKGTHGACRARLRRPSGRGDSRDRRGFTSTRGVPEVRPQLSRARDIGRSIGREFAEVIGGTRPKILWRRLALFSGRKAKAHVVGDPDAIGVAQRGSKGFFHFSNVGGTCFGRQA